ncbi:MAG: hypothetical protein EBV19_07630, partial [Flavobacteriia bacterium]|nr:hypothetical protein [Flavobacteriia bacterium]
RMHIGVYPTAHFKSISLIESAGVIIDVAYIYMGNGDLRFFLNDYRLSLFCGNIMTISMSILLALFFYYYYITIQFELYV